MLIAAVRAFVTFTREVPLKTAAVLVFAILSIMRSECAAEATPAITREQVDAIVKPAAEVANLSSVAVGTIDSSARAFYGYGKVVPDGRTLFEIGSVTKTFTATLLADIVLRGDVALDTPVGELLPADVGVPSSQDGTTITLLHLTT